MLAREEPEKEAARTGQAFGASESSHQQVFDEETIPSSPTPRHHPYHNHSRYTTDPHTPL